MPCVDVFSSEKLTQKLPTIYKPPYAMLRQCYVNNGVLIEDKSLCNRVESKHELIIKET